MADIFISYRRTDAAGYAFALHRDLCLRFPPNRIFFDRKSIESGEKFHQRIRVAVSECQVLLALIGPGWRDARDASGNRPLDNPQDVVRGEIALALHLDKTVIPILFDDTPVPELDELPDLKPLSGHDARPERRQLDLVPQVGCHRPLEMVNQEAHQFNVIDLAGSLRVLQSLSQR
jgi:hypothetical protein